jgi:hypothetical protein
LTLLLLLLNWDDGTCRASSSSPRNETVSQEPRLFLSLSNLDSSFFLDYFPLEEFFRILPNVERWGENVLIPLYTVCVCTQGTGYPVRQTTSHRILYRGDGKTNWTDCIKAAKKVDVDFKKTFSTTGCWVGGVSDTDGHLVATTHPSSSSSSSQPVFLPKKSISDKFQVNQPLKFNLGLR